MPLRSLKPNRLDRLVFATMIVIALGGFYSASDGQVCSVNETQRLLWTDDSPDDTTATSRPLTMSGNWGAMLRVAGPLGQIYLTHFDGAAWSWAGILQSPLIAGHSNVSMDGTVLVTGVFDADFPGLTNAGAAVVFHRVGDTWQQPIVLTDPFGGTFHGRMGRSTAVSGDTMVVGANNVDQPTLGLNGRGAAYVFVYNGTEWVFQQKLTAPVPTNAQQFGTTVDIDGDTIAVGAVPLIDGPDRAIYIYRRSAGVWTHEQTLIAPGVLHGDQFATTLALKGDVVVAGARLYGPTDQGAAFVFEYDGRQWSFSQRLETTDAEPGSDFGRVVDTDGNFVMVSAPGDEVYNNPGTPLNPADNAGSIYLFSNGGSGWTLHHRLNSHHVEPPNGASNDTNDDYLGHTQAVADGKVMAYAPGDFAVRWFDIVPPDCDGDGFPDVCENDCNANQAPDDCETAASGAAWDCNTNSSPDECEAGFTYIMDDNKSELVDGGLVSGGDYIWLNQFSVLPGAEYVTHVSVAWVGTTPSGTYGTMLLYDDPNNDGQPHDAVLLATAPALATDEFGFAGVVPSSVYPINRTYVGEPGDSFFIGVLYSPQPGMHCARYDVHTQLGRAWRAYSTDGPADIEDLSANEGLAQTNGSYIVRGLALDCNGNGIWDQCDIASGFSLDLNSNGLPDECEPSASPCPADIAPLGSPNGTVNVEDLLAVIGAWGPCGNPNNCPADIAPSAGDDVVNVEDLLAVIGAWGSCP